MILTHTLNDIGLLCLQLSDYVMLEFDASTTDDTKYIHVDRKLSQDKSSKNSLLDLS